MSLVRKRCPIVRLAACLEAEGTLDMVERDRLDRDVETAVEEAVRFAESAPYPDRTEVLDDVV